MVGRAVEGYYVVSDHHQHPEPRAETERVEGVPIRSYVIPVMQEKPIRKLRKSYLCVGSFTEVRTA